MRNTGSTHEIANVRLAIRGNFRPHLRADNIGKRQKALQQDSDISASAHDRQCTEGVSFPFKISSQDLTGCHYRSALLDGSSDE